MNNILSGQIITTDIDLSVQLNREMQMGMLYLNPLANTIDSTNNGVLFSSFTITEPTSVIVIPKEELKALKDKWSDSQVEYQITVVEFNNHIGDIVSVNKMNGQSYSLPVAYHTSYTKTVNLKD
jgi:hypothetical protein